MFSRVRALILSCLALTLVAVTLVSTARADDVSEAAPGFADRIDTPLARRLLTALDAAGIPRASVSLVVRPLNAAQPLVAMNAYAPRNPASVMKIVTTFAALDQLGPGYRWRTEAFVDRRPDQLGRVKQLYIRGTGNPFWVTDEFHAFLRAIYARGVREVSGDLVLDRSYYDVLGGDPAAFDDEPFRVYNALPDPLTLNFNSVSLLLVPNVDGHRLDVQIDPPTTTLAIQNDVRLKRRSCEGRNVQVKVDVFRDDNGFANVGLSGEFPNRCRAYEIVRALLTPEEQLIGAFEARWDELGGTWTGGARNEPVPESAIRIFEQPSRTLGDVIRSLNKFSNNVMTRQLFLTLGAEANEAPATLDKSRDAVREALERNGIGTQALVIDNGAGLSRDSRVNAALLIQLLDAAWRHQYAPEFFASMPVPGVDGTLASRFKTGDFVGQAHIKTGTIDHVTALAGMVQRKDGERVLVAFLINHKDTHLGNGRSLQKILLRQVLR